jgi:hypothetical protein
MSVLLAFVSCPCYVDLRKSRLRDGRDSANGEVVRNALNKRAFLRLPLPARHLEDGLDELVEPRMPAQAAIIDVLIHAIHVAGPPQVHEPVELVDEWRSVVLKRKAQRLRPALDEPSQPEGARRPLLSAGCAAFKVGASRFI